MIFTELSHPTLGTLLSAASRFKKVQSYGTS